MIYQIYDVHLASDLPFPELPAASGSDVDVRVHIRGERLPAKDDTNLSLMHESRGRFEGRPLFQAYRHDAGHLLRYADTGDFEIPGHGREIVCYPVPGAAVEDIRACVLGPALAVRFHLLGSPVLHASAAVIDGRAAAFVDWSGGGKSTTAAAFLQLGYPLLTDDVLVLRESGGVFYATPGYPVVRLRPEAIASLIGAPDQFPRVRPRREKRWVPVRHAFHAASCRLAAIYLLGVDQPSIGAPAVMPPAAISQIDAVVELMRNTYGVGWMGAEIQARHFEDYCRLVSSVPVRSVSFSRELSQLAAVRSAILDDFRVVASVPVGG
jgi:hypothetical protein